MSRTLFTGIGWAVEKQTIAANTTLTGPILVSAVSTSPNSVRLTFDRTLQLEYRMYVPPGGYRAKTLDIASYSIAKVVGGAPLIIVRTVWVDGTHVDLLTENQDAESYRVTAVAGGVMDFWGNLITEQTADFTGQQKADYYTPSTLRTFTSGYAGMQEDTPSEIYPDLAAPFLQNQNPPASGPNEDPAASVYLEIRDTDEGVNKSSILIWIDSVLAYRGDTDTFISPYNGPGCSIVLVGDLYQVTIDPISPFDEHHTVSVRVYARDLAPIYNTLDTTYTYHTWDHSGPLVDSYAPTGTGVSKSTLINFSVDENAGSGVNINSLDITVGGVPAIVNGVFQPGFDGPSSAITPHHLGYDVVIQKTSVYGSYTLVGVDLYVEDAESNVTSFSWNFRTEDYLGPLVHPTVPALGEMNVPGNTNVTIEVTDDHIVNSGSVRVRIDTGSGWVTAYQQGDTPAFKPGYDGPGSTVVSISGGYRVTIDPTTDFEVSTLVKVEVSAADPEGNPERLG